MDQCADAERDVVADDVIVGFEHPVFLGVGLDLGAAVQCAAGADRDQSPLGNCAAVVEHSRSNPHAEQTPYQRLEGGPVENRHVSAIGLQLPVPLVPPEVGVIDGAELRLQPPGPEHEVLDADGGQHANNEHDDERSADCQETKSVRQIEAGKCHQYRKRREDPADKQQERHRTQIVPVLGREVTAEIGAVRMPLGKGVPQNRAWDLEWW